jgi:hypothetical protein
MVDIGIDTGGTYVFVGGEDSLHLVERHLLAEELEDLHEGGTVDGSLLVPVKHVEEVLGRERLAWREAARPVRVLRVARIQREAELVERDEPSAQLVALLEVRQGLGCRQLEVQVAQQHRELVQVDAARPVRVVLVEELAVVGTPTVRPRALDTK